MHSLQQNATKSTTQRKPSIIKVCLSFCLSLCPITICHPSQNTQFRSLTDSTDVVSKVHPSSLVSTPILILSWNVIRVVNQQNHCLSIDGFSSALVFPTTTSMMIFQLVLIISEFFLFSYFPVTPRVVIALQVDRAVNHLQLTSNRNPNARNPLL